MTTHSTPAPTSTPAAPTSTPAAPMSTPAPTSTPAAPMSTSPRFAVAPGPVPGPMSLLGSELGRLLNLRSTWGYILAMLAFMIGLPLIMWLSSRSGSAEFAYEPTFAKVLLGADIVVIIAMIFAAAGSASEISGRRVAFGYLTGNSRVGVHCARLVAQVIIVAAATLVGSAVATAFLAAVGVLVPEDAGTAVTVIGIVLLWTAIASAVGMLFPVTAVAVGLPIAWILVIELAIANVPIDFFQTLMKYLPWISSRQLTDNMDIGVSDLHAGLVLAAWSVVVLVVGIVVASRRDVK